MPSFPTGEPSLGVLVRERRLAAGWSQRRLAQAAGVSVDVVRDLERGISSRPRQAAVGRLTSALGIVLLPAEAVSPPVRTDDGGIGAALRLQVLGPVKAWREGVALPLGGVRRQAVLGLLAVQAGVVVRQRALCEALWDGEPPPTAAVMIQSHISRLRAVLEQGTPARTRQRVLETMGDGYRLRVDSMSTDLAESRSLAVRARGALRSGSRTSACELFERAVELWRADPLADVAVLRSHPVVTGLEREYAALVVEQADAASALGWHDLVLPRLFALTERAPLNERAHACLMIALAGSGQQAAALEVYERMRRRLDDELGVRPGAPLAQAHARVLRQEIPAVVTGSGGFEGADRAAADAGEGGMAADAVPGAGVSPFQLPPTVVDFTGRVAEDGWLREWLIGGSGTAVSVVVISGPPGVGKSALMLHAGHGLRAHFPDGQLWASLDGASGRPRDPGEVLGEWLRALGVHGFAVPKMLDERAALFRSVLAGRRVLVAADDVGSVGQVLPLLPGTSGCAVIATSRRQLPDLAGVRMLPLGPLPAGEARQLLGQIAGSARVSVEGQAAADLVAACGHLPLAVRIAGAKLAARPSSPIAALAESLATERRRLDVLRVGDLSVRASIASGYQALSQTARRAFGLLALLGPCDVAEWVIGALLGDTDAAPVVEELIDRSMLAVIGADHTGQARYRLHDLLRDYAIEKLAIDPEPGQSLAVERAQHAWLQLASCAADQLPQEPWFPRQPDGEEPSVVARELARALTADPLAWFSVERVNLLAATERACQSWGHGLGLRLAYCQTAFQNLQDRHDDSARMWQVVATAARRAGDTSTATAAELRLAAATLEQGYLADAVGRLRDCVAVLERDRDDANLAFALYWLSACEWGLDRYEESRRHADRGVALARRTHDPHAELINLRILGIALARLGDRQESVAACERAMSIAIGLGETLAELYALHELAFCCVLAGHYERAAELAQVRLKLSKDMGYLSSEALSLGVLGDAYSALGMYEEAVAAYSEALPVFRDHFIRRNHALCLYKLGLACHAMAHAEEAQRYLKESLPLFRELRLPAYEERAENLLRECGALPGLIDGREPAAHTGQLRRRPLANG
jgi:DNA-binding SARP family transcriptional activator/tetratricopeptide (TPR) repeat protein